MTSAGGTYGVPVVINGQITLTFTIDSGAADVTITGDVARTLVRTGAIKKQDFVGQKLYVLADGTQMPSSVFRLRSVRVGSTEVHDVLAAIGPYDGSLLLGQSFLKKLTSWSIDNARHEFLINPGAGDAQPPASSMDADDPFVGTWIQTNAIVSQRLSETFQPGPRRTSRTFRYTDRGLEFTANWVEAFGTELNERRAIIDGKDYAWINGNETMSLTRIGRRSIEFLLKNAGRVAEVGTAELSENGTSLTITSKRPEEHSGFHIREEYQKQDPSDEFANARATKPAQPRYSQASSGTHEAFPRDDQSLWDAASKTTPARLYLAKAAEAGRLSVIDSAPAVSGESFPSSQKLQTTYAQRLELSEHWWFWAGFPHHLVIAVNNRVAQSVPVNGLVVTLYREEHCPPSDGSSAGPTYYMTLGKRLEPRSLSVFRAELPVNLNEWHCLLITGAW